MTLKQQIQRLVETLPEDDPAQTLEELQYRLYVLEKSRKGFGAIDQGAGISHEQVLERMKKWLA